MPRFQVHDTVVLRDQPSFIGSIERTNLFDSEPLEECLIIAHTDVPTDVLREFVQSGTPPAGFVFVQFASQEKGSSLVAEADLILIDRLFELGDVVKVNGTQTTGTVVDVKARYVLDPVWLCDSASDDFAAKPANQSRNSHHACTATCSSLDPRLSHPDPARLIHNVPFEELKRAQDFIEGDYVLQQDWLGMVDGVDLTVIILLEDHSVVVVADAEELFIPIPDYGRPLVSLPEFDGIPRPSYVFAAQGWGNLIPPEDLEIGQLVITNKKNLQHGRWLRGSYNESIKPQGFVLMVKCGALDVQWLVCNALTAEKPEEFSRPRTFSPYENLEYFTKPQELRRHKRLVLYDPSRHVTHVHDRSRSRPESGSRAKSSSSVNLSSNFNVGQRVRFRDPAGAAVKYAGDAFHDIMHGGFYRIAQRDTLGFDLNEFDIVHSQQIAVVRMQDGSISEESSTNLGKHSLFETDITPADIVVAREGMKQKSLNTDGSATTTDFNEMTIFEKDHELWPDKVGIIQSVQPDQRLATVRWFEDSRIYLGESGNSLIAGSRFGKISDVIENVSLYEVMAFDGLLRKIRDIVIIPPSRIHRDIIHMFQTRHDFGTNEQGVNNISILSQLQDREPHRLLSRLQQVASLSLAREWLMSVPSTGSVDSYHYVDWVGEICELRADGKLVVRVNHDGQCEDVLLDHDQILLFVDEQIWGMNYDDDPMDLDDDSDTSSEPSDASEEVIDEVVEYEGGERLDDDPDDENWASDEEEQDTAVPRIPTVSIDQHASSEAEQLDEVISTVSNEAAQTGQTRTQASAKITGLASWYPKDEPPAFFCLEREPPPDQYRVSMPAQPSSAYLKRMAKEHRILSTTLPQRQIYVRTYESRLDLLRCLIIGSADTPYEYAPFLIDLHLGPNYPREPPTAHFHSWTAGMGRINPNLYEEGKICLSLLGTWPGRSETEGWTEHANIYQLLVSLQGLVFVRTPFFNEAGYEGYAETQQYTHESLQYSEKAYVSARNFVKHALSSPPGGVEDILAWMYLPKYKLEEHRPELQHGLLKKIIDRGLALIARSEELRGPSKQLGGVDDEDDRLLSGDGGSSDPTKVFMKPLSMGAIVMLRKSIHVLVDLHGRELIALFEISSAVQDK